MPKAKALPVFVAKRGRPNAKQVAAIEQSILTTAYQMFLDQGFDAVAMEAVAAVAGVSKGTLYARYPSKEALFIAIIEDRISHWSMASSQNDHLLTDNIGERLRHHGHNMVHHLFQPDFDTLQRLLLATRDRFPQLSRAMYEVGYLYIVRLIAKDIADAAKRDGIAAREPEAIARMFVSAIFGRHMQESGAGPLTLDAMTHAADQIVHLFMSARQSW